MPPIPKAPRYTKRDIKAEKARAEYDPTFPADFDPEQYVDARTASIALGGITSATLMSYRIKYKIPHVRLSAKKFLYSWPAILAILAERLAK